MPRRMDFGRPYGEIIGLPGAAYEQDGIKYGLDGTEALDIQPIVEEVNVKQPDDILPAVTVIEQKSVPVRSTISVSIEDMSPQKLKALVETYGHKYTTKEDALKFLNRKK